MDHWMRPLFCLAFAILALAGAARLVAAAGPVAVLAAENFYGDLAKQVGGEAVAVGSIMSNPDQDPHEFEASPATARAIARARLVIFNGADYDPWMAKLLAAAPKGQRVLEVARLAGRNPGDNPHLRYDLGAVRTLVAALATELAALDPPHAADFAARRATVEAGLGKLDERVAALRRAYAGAPVTATEPVFGYMADALGLVMRNQRFQIAVMNDTEPGASEVAAFERDLKERRVALLLYNSQAGSPLTKRMQDLASAAKIPVVGVSELAPEGVSYQAWIAGELDAVAAALASAKP
jgi:zinc/manganese transport system substrate-binding protein